MKKYNIFKKIIFLLLALKFFARKIIFWLLILFLGLCFLYAYLRGKFFGNKPNNSNTNKVLDIISEDKVKGVDPAHANDRASAYQISNVYEGLFDFHYLKRPYDIIPALAESMPIMSTDGLDYIIKIKKGIKFHDNKCFPNGVGRELVADDFVYSIKRLADVKTQSACFSNIDGLIEGLNEWRNKYINSSADYNEVIAGLQAFDKYTLKIRLTRPHHQFIYLLALHFTYVVPKEAVLYYGRQFANNPVGTGPFVIQSAYNPQDSKIVYLKNKNYRENYFPTEGFDLYSGMSVYAGKKLPFADKVIVHIITEQQPSLLNFEKGKLDFLPLSSSLSKEYKLDNNVIPSWTAKGIKLFCEPSSRVDYYGFNTENEYLKNKKIRQAMGLAFDEERFKSLFLEKSSISAQSILPPGFLGYDSNYVNPYKCYDLDKARKLLEEAGYPDGEGLPEFNLDVKSETIQMQMGEFFKNCMEKLGINIRVISNLWPVLIKKAAQGEAAILRLGWSPDIPDSQDFFQLFYGANVGSSYNYTRYRNNKYDKLYGYAMGINDLGKKEATYKSMNEIVGNDMPVIVLPYSNHNVAYHSWLRNYVASDFIYNQVKYLDIDMVKKDNYK